MEGRRSRTYVMGILNATPDSFSDGGQHYRRAGGVATAVEHALKMVRDGADVLDIGGESTRQARRLLLCLRCCVSVMFCCSIWLGLRRCSLAVLEGWW